MTPPSCYTCALLGAEVDGTHQHAFEDLVRAELLERDVRPYRSRALWELVAASRAINPAKSKPAD